MLLPTLKKIKVEHLSLYTQTISMKIYPGLNLVIGGNGIGKTTFINTILFGLVGNATYESFNGSEKNPLIDEGYFHGRLDVADQELAQVTVIIEAKKDEITITRALDRPRILRLLHKRSGSHTAQSIKGSAAELEQKYRKLIEKLLGIPSFEDFVFVVANLLIFDENRRTLAWDPEVQNRMIRLLSVPRRLDNEYSRLSTLITQFDTKGRHKSEDRKRIRRSIDKWIEAKAQHDAPQSNESSREQIEKRLNEMDRDIDRLQAELESDQAKIRSEVLRLKELNERADQLQVTRAPLIESQTDLETEFYGGIYSTVPAAYVLLLEALVKRGLCEFCHNQGRQLRTLGRELKTGGLCIVCRSPVDYTKSPESHDRESLGDQIDSIRERVEQLDVETTTCAAAQAISKTTISELQRDLVEKSRRLRDLDTERFDLRTRYALLTADSADGEPDLWLEAQNRAIQKLNDEIAKHYRKRDEKKLQLNEINEQIVEILHQVNENLTPLFSDFASEFLGTTCELVITEKTRQRKPVAYMYPRFLNKDRPAINQVSESQRFFIDQAFRMALISWFSQANGGETFCIVETPEGSLDLAYEENVAKMYLEFAKQGHSIVATSNLNSSKFLETLFKQLGDDPKRNVLDLLAYGRLTSVQGHYKPAFNRSLKKLNLPPL